MNKHTPGPWRIEGQGTIVADSGSHRRLITRMPVVGVGGIDDITAANARLIAAAPELLEALVIACRDLRVHIEEDEKRMNLKHACPCLAELEKCEAVIAKAQGK